MGFVGLGGYSLVIGGKSIVAILMGEVVKLDSGERVWSGALWVDVGWSNVFEA